MASNNFDPTLIISAAESSDAAAFQEFLSVLRNVDIAKYTLVATAALFVYDYFLTLDEEVFLVWPSRLGAPKIFFFLNRYFPFVDLALLIYVLMAGSDPSLCVKMFQGLGGTVAFGFVIAQLILAMRTWAIWARKPAITAILAVLLLVSLGVDVYVLRRYLSGISFTDLGPLAPAYQGCPLHFNNRFVFVDFVIVMVTESVMLGLLIIKALEHFKHSRSTLMVRMFKDGVVYFIFILITSISNLIVILVAPVELHNFLIITQRILHSVFCSRVLLHIRGAYTNKGLYSTTTGDSQIQSGGAYAFRRPVSDYAPASSNRGRRAQNAFQLTNVEVDDRESGGAVNGGWGLGNGYDVAPNSDFGLKRMGWTESEREWDKPPLSPLPFISPMSSEAHWRPPILRKGSTGL